MTDGQRLIRTVFNRQSYGRIRQTDGVQPYLCQSIWTLQKWIPLCLLWYDHLKKDSNQARQRLGIYEEVVAMAEASHNLMTMVLMKLIIVYNPIKAKHTPHPTSQTAGSDTVKENLVRPPGNLLHVLFSFSFFILSSSCYNEMANPHHFCEK